MRYVTNKQWLRGEVADTGKIFSYRQLSYDTINLNAVSNMSYDQVGSIIIETNEDCDWCPNMRLKLGHIEKVIASITIVRKTINKPSSRFSRMGETIFQMVLQ